MVGANTWLLSAAAAQRVLLHAWQPALDSHGNPRDDAQAAELTRLLRHSLSGDRHISPISPDASVVVGISDHHH